MEVDGKYIWSQDWDGYCPECRLKGEKVRMRLNSWDFYECEECKLQIAIGFPNVQCVILKFKGEGKFRHIVQYAHDHENGEMYSPHILDYPPYCKPELFQNE